MTLLAHIGYAFPSASSPSEKVAAAGAFTSGCYPNLFSMLLNKTDQQVRSKIDSAFRQLFYGDDRSQRIYYPVEPDMAYIEDVLHQDIRTEGMSYGMMIAVQLDKKQEFDRLWKWAKTHMQHPDGPRRGFFAWHCRTDGTVIDANTASDGEEWFVTALFFASGRWGDGTGMFNYRAEAQAILDAMLSKQRQSDREDVVTNLFNWDEKQVVFVPAGNADDFTDPSYHLPHFYELWARWADQHNDFWRDAAVASRNFLKKAAHPVTGLTPDYARFDGRPTDAPWDGGHSDFRFDAWRTAMNVAVDYSWFTADDWAVAQSDRLLLFFHSQGLDHYVNNYTLDGKPLSSDRSIGLAAMNAVACLAATIPQRREFVEALWEAPIPSGIYRYYDGVLTLLALLQTGGQFRVYAPTLFRTGAVESYVTSDRDRAALTLFETGRATPLLASQSDFPGVIRVIKQVQQDIGRVAGQQPDILFEDSGATKEIIVAGTLGRNRLIDQLAQQNKLDVDAIRGKWEAFLIQVVDHPWPSVDRALVLVGSDKRGTIFALYDLAEKIGVSPWYWWADVPVQHHSALYIRPGAFYSGEPKVKYRGIFINDESPALSGWACEKFGGFNAKFYDKVFELILRLKGNFLWPAMWGRAFYDDDPLNAKLADEYGVVISTSHHEPMMRAHEEWARYGTGPWNYEKNSATLQQFWQRGIERMNGNESIVTIGMRGDGDEPMSEEANIALLERIVQDQREIIGRVTGKPVETVPQVWALYKEVQEYYDKGMRVPDDVTLLLCDDNWGNIRRLPPLGEKPRPGGYGIYYHFDYVGDPRNYKWLNTTQISRVWEQMHLAYSYGVDRIWIVNVGDIKPMEFPISFFLDYAWDPGRWPAERLPEYAKGWAEQQFGAKQAQQIADILTAYTRFNSRRKPELLTTDTYSLTSYREAEAMVADYQRLLSQALQVREALPGEYQPAFYQLVLHPVEACANLNELYVTAGRNRWFAEQERSETNALAERAARLYTRDAEITDYYNHTLLDGKWNHLMDQTHIGYTTWQQPEIQSMPAVKTLQIPPDAAMGVAIEGSRAWWPAERSEAALPEFDCLNRQTHYLEVFNRGRSKFKFTIKPAKAWIRFDRYQGEVEFSERLWVTVDWARVPAGTQRIPIIIQGPGKNRVTVYTVVRNTPARADETAHRFLESDSCVSIEAEHYSRAVDLQPVVWQKIPDLGRTLSAMTIEPVTASAQTPDDDHPRLEYDTYLYTAGEVTIKTFLSPTLNFPGQQGLRYAISIDDELPQIINMHEGRTHADWQASVSDNITICASKHVVARPGMHTCKFWAVDAGVMLQKIVLETGAVKPSYLGPPESLRK